MAMIQGPIKRKKREQNWPCNCSCTWRWGLSRWRAVETPAIPSADAAHRVTWKARERRTKMEMARTVLLFFILILRWTGHQKQFISS